MDDPGGGKCPFAFGWARGQTKTGAGNGLEPSPMAKKWQKQGGLRIAKQQTNQPMKNSRVFIRLM
jgi:hypothetical protein